MRPLTWSLVVATLNREECLLRSLRANVAQDRPPKQVIVVDSSDNWEAVRARVLGELATDPSIPWTYLHSDQRSLTHQRNLGFVHCDADVVFFLDDDSFMYPDCAREILDIYEADPSGAIGGVCARLTTQSPEAPRPTSSAAAPGPTPAARPGLVERLKGRLEPLWYQEHLFIPYDGAFHHRRVAGFSEHVAAPVTLFHGCRMTFRTAAARDAGGFQEMLIRGGFGEDADFSYRVSRQHALVMAMRAFLYHEQTPVQRAKVSVNACLVLLNSIALYRLNAESPPPSRGVVYRFLAKRLLLELLRDGGRGAREAPNVRGALRAARHAAEVVSSTREELRARYPALQAHLYTVT